MPEPRKLRVFLCHSSQDKPTVRELYKRLEAEGWIDPWLDEEKLYPGQEWDVEIEEAVEQTDVVLVCLSTHSVDKEGYIQKELRFVLNIAETKPEGAIFVVPLRLDDCLAPRRLSMWQYVDYFPKNRRDWAYQRLLESLKLRAARLGISTVSITEEKARLEEERVRMEKEKAKKEREERERKAADEFARKQEHERARKAAEEHEKRERERAATETSEQIKPEPEKIWEPVDTSTLESSPAPVLPLQFLC